MKDIFKLLKIVKTAVDFNKLSIPWLVVLIVFFSCEEKLIEKPKSVAAELFYNTVEEVEAGVNAIYSPMRANVIAEQIVVLDAHTDWGYGRGSRANYNDFAGFNSGNINIAGTRWNAFYTSIRNANLIIKNAPSGTSISTADIDKYVAEAKFLRAFAYFNLVRNWGGVPLRTEVNMTVIDVPRSSPDEVYELIVSDLLQAEQHLPETPKHLGRPTRFAAKTFLADVYLTLGMFQQARDKANEVIASNRFSLVPVTSKQGFQLNLFGPTVTTTPEEIFYFKYTRQPNFGNWILWVLNHPSTGLFNFGGAYAHYGDATNKFYTTWDDNDIRKSLWDKINFGLGPNTLVSNKYIDPSAVSQTGGGNDLPIYRYAEVLLIFAEASCKVAGGPTTEGIEALNKVHRRAYGLNPVAPSIVDFKIEDYNENSFLNLVLKERAYEFQFEGKRWLDLKRTGKAAETILDVKGIVIAEKHYLWPIPIEEINFNDGIRPEDQNPGY